jgi:hypothetical protein
MIERRRLRLSLPLPGHHPILCQNARHRAAIFSQVPGSGSCEIDGSRSRRRDPAAPLIAPNRRQIVAARGPVLCARGPPVGRLDEHARDRRLLTIYVLGPGWQFSTRYFQFWRGLIAGASESSSTVWMPKTSEVVGEGTGGLGAEKL